MRKYVAVLEWAGQGTPIAACLTKVTIELEAQDMHWARHEVESAFPVLENRDKWRWLKLEEVGS